MNQRDKKTPVRATRKKLGLSPIRLFFMKKLKDWCSEPNSREAKTERKKQLANVLGKDVQTLKNMYLYGQGSLDDWFKAMDYIGPLNQETIIQLYDSYLYIENKLKSLTPEQMKLHRLVSKMSESELSLLNQLIETGLKVNKAIKKP